MLRSNFFARLIARTCLALGLLGLFAGTASAELKCLFVCRDRTTHWTGVAYDRLEAMGFTMTEVHDNGAFNGFPTFTAGSFTSGAWTTAMLEEYDLIFFDYDSSSPNSDIAGLANCTKPVVIQKYLGLNSVHRITSDDAVVHDSSVLAQTDMVIANLVGNSILAEAGLTPGSTVAFTATGGKNIQSIDLNSGAIGLAPGAVVLATVPASSATFPGTGIIWTMEAGAATHGGGTTAGKRAGFGLFGAFPGTVTPGTSVYTAADLTPQAGKLFDAMIHWLVPASNIQVTVTPNPLSFTGSTGVTTTQTLVVTASTSVSSITLTAATLNPAGAPFTLSTPPLPLNLLAGTSTTLNVGFTPVTSAVFSTTATLNFSNSRGPTTVNVPITATSSVNRINNWIQFE